MSFNYNIHISNNEKTYNFDLILNDKNLSSGYTVRPTEEADLTEIRTLLKNAQKEGSLTIEALATRLEHQNPNSTVNITNLFAKQFAPSSVEAIDINPAPNKTGHSNIIEKSLKHIQALLYPSGIPQIAHEKLASTESQQKIQTALNQPLPGIFNENRKAADNDLLTFPPLFKKRKITAREGMLIGTIATLLGEGIKLASKLDASKKSTAIGKLTELESGLSTQYQLTGEQQEGDPCIVMQSGLGNDGGIWGEVKDFISESSGYASLSYDRPGLGLSDPNFSSDSSDIKQIVSHLDALLSTLEERNEIHSPYVLVGHSFGGACMQAYALEYPEKISALVLVDSSSDSQRSDKGRLGTPQHIPSIDFPTDLMPDSLASLLFDDALNQLTAVKENENFTKNLETLAKMKEKKHPPFGDLPLRIIDREFMPEEIDEMDEKDRGRIQEAAKFNQNHLRSGSTNCKGERLKGVGHYIQLEAPQIVAKAVIQAAKIIDADRKR